jgi:simple sugar transport system substrate-binding protein
MAPVASVAENSIITDDQLEIRFVGVFIEAEFFKPVIRGMEEAAEIFNVDAVFTGSTGADVEEQNRMIRQFADEGVDGIAVDIIDDNAYNDAIAYAMDKGVPVVAFNVDATNGEGPHLAFTQQYFVDAGKSIASYVIDDIPEGATVLVTQHDPGVSALEDRAAGVKAILASKNLNVIDKILVNNAQEAKSLIIDELNANPDISVIIATGNADTEGAGLASKETGRDLIVAGFDLSTNILAMIEEGIISATTDQQPYMQGFYPVVQLVLNNRYGLLPSNIDAGSGLVTKDNATAVKALAAAGYR